MARSAIRRYGRWLLVSATIIAVTVAVAGGAYLATPYHGPAGSIDRVESDPAVAVSQQDGTYRLSPTEGNASAGLVFYPGARVHPDAYLATLAPLASEANVTVIVPKLPLNLAVLDTDAAGRYVTDSSVDRWYVGGHSLGGAMACRYAAGNPDALAGVVLYAAYCDRDLSGTDLAVLSVTGSADTVLDRERYEASRANLPADATHRELPLNHSQFGSYRGQRGDTPSGVSYDRAHERLSNVTVAWFERQRDSQ